MAWEQLLVLLFFVVLPIVQGLLRKRKAEQRPSDPYDVPERHRTSERDWESEPVALDPRVYLPPVPPAPVRRPEPVVSPPLVRRPPADARAPEQRTRERAARPVPLPGGAEGFTAARSIKATLRGSGGLRQAVLMSVILGKPRSVDPPRFQ